MNYFLNFENHDTHFISITAEFDCEKEEEIEILLPKWRPGRYELGNFAKNVVDVKVTSKEGRELPWQKTQTHSWKVNTKGVRSVVFQYDYFAHEKNAGSSCLDHELIYVNPVNLLVYRTAQLEEPVDLHFDLPDGYTIASGIKYQNGKIHAKDFHEITDTPFIASKSMQHRSFNCEGVEIHLWFQGHCNPDFDRLHEDFNRFCAAQLQMFGHFPQDDFHFMFIIHGDRFYHGVEHVHSTVIALGPSFNLTSGTTYQDLLGVSCHELFHVWNVKSIRPAEMRPYLYDRENYSALHYITEGITTYYGDLMLLKSGVWTFEEFILNFDQAIFQRFFAHDGGDHISLEQASFDSWLTGYNKGVPNRKISFYTKGCLVSFIFDYLIRKHSKNEHSLDDIIVQMHREFGMTAKGYDKESYVRLLSHYAGIEVTSWMNKYVSGTDSLVPILQEATAYFGLSLVEYTLLETSKDDWGFRVKSGAHHTRVIQIKENSPASKAGFHLEDSILAVNGYVIKKDLDEILRSVSDESLDITLIRDRRLKTVKLIKQADWKPNNYHIMINPDASAEQIANRDAWMKTTKPSLVV